MLKRTLSLVLAVLMTVSLCCTGIFASDTVTSPVDVYFEGETALDPVVLDSSANQVVWSGNVPFTANSSDGIVGFTLVYDIQGIESPIDPGLFDIGFNGSNKVSNYYFWKNSWQGAYLREMVDGFYENGKYYTYIQSRMVDQTKFTSVNSFTLFKTGYSTTVSNENDNATFQLLAIIENNLQPTVEFYDENGVLLGQATHAYTNGPTSIDWANALKFYGFGKLLTPTQLAETIDGIELPTKASDETYNYRLVWKNADGEIVDGVYKSEELYADFVPVEKTSISVTFVDAEGNNISTDDQNIGANPVFNGTAPTKSEDATYTYTFAGWSLDGETVLDFAEYTLEGDAVTFIPVFKSDLKLKAEIIADSSSIDADGEVTISFKLNRADITVDVLNSVTEPITSGELVLEYSGVMFTSGDADADAAGKITVPFTSVSEDGTVDATVTLTPTGVAYGKNTLMVNSGSVASANRVADMTVSASAGVSVTGNLTGVYFEGDSALAPVVLGTEKQNVWEGFVPNTFTHANGAGGVTFIYKVDGVETAIDPGYMDVSFNGTKFSYSWFYNTDNKEAGTWGGVENRAVVDLPENGYYFTYLPQRISQSGPTLIKNVTAFTLFNGGTIVNENENATLTMLAVLENNVTPTVNFYGADNVLLGTATHKYTNGAPCTDGNTSYDSTTAAHGKLLTPAELYATVSTDVPVKAEDALYTYEFAGWVDADGEPVEAIYKNQDVYASFTATLKAVAKIGDTEYGTLEEALAAATDGATIKLVADIDLTETVIVSTRVILDLNGKTVSTDSADPMFENRAPNFWIANNADTVASIVTTVDGGTAIYNRAAILVSDNDIIIDAANGTALNSTGAGLIAGGVWKGNVVHTGFGPLVSGGTYTTDPTPYLSDRYIAVYEDGVYYVVTNPAYGKVAKIGDNYYATLDEALAAITDGCTLELIDDVSVDYIIEINREIVFEGNGHTITTTGARAINVEVNGEVTIQNLVIAGGEGCQRGINVINQAADLTLDNVTVSGVSHYAVHVATSAGAGTSVTISNSDLSGYAALAVYGDDRTVTVTGTSLEGVNTYADNGSNDYAVIALGGEDVTIKVDETSTVTAASTGGAKQYAVIAHSDTTANAVIEIAASIDVTDADGILKEFTEGNTVAFRAEYEDALYAEGYAVDNYSTADGMIVVDGVYVAENVQTAVKYTSVADALAAAVSGQRVTLLANTAETYVMVTPGVVLDMNGYELTAEYVVGFKGSSVINGKNNADGKLIVAAENVSLDQTNAYGGYTYLPIYDAENGCYVFTMVSMAAHGFDAELNEYTFIPYMMSYANAYLDEVNEIANSGVNVVLRLTWEDAEGTYTATQDFTYADEFVETVIDSFNTTKANNYSQMYYAVLSGTEVTLGNNVAVSFAVISGSGVEAVSNSISIEF